MTSITVEHAYLAADLLRSSWAQHSDGSLDSDDMALVIEEAGEVIEWLLTNWLACGEALNATTAERVREKATGWQVARMVESLAKENDRLTEALRALGDPAAAVVPPSSTSEAP